MKNIMPTALELTRKEWMRYLEAPRRRPAPPKLTAEERRTREHLLALVRQAADLLKSRFGLRRVVLFGSLADDVWFRADSDVDLAVEGLSAEDYWDAWRLVEDVIRERPVDLIEIERAGKALRQVIERYGIEL